MPVQTKKTGVLSRYGAAAQQAIADAQKAEFSGGGGLNRIPPGIHQGQGIAQLEECGFFEADKDKKYPGHAYFQAVGICREPQSVMVNGQECKCEGLQTRQFIYLCEENPVTKKVEFSPKRLLQACDVMKGLAGDDNFDVSDPDAAAKLLQEAAPHFRFSTSVRKGREYIDPRTKEKKVSDDGVWENWHGSKGLEGYVPGANGQQQVNDGSPEAGGPPGAEPPSPDAPAVGDNLDELLALAKIDGEGQPQEARNRLRQMAIDAGHDPAAVDAAPAWEDVKAMIEAKASAGGADEWRPAVGETYAWTRPANPKTKTKAVKVEVDIVAVDAAKQTVDFKCKDNKAVVKGVAWDKLESAE